MKHSNLRRRCSTARSLPLPLAILVAALALGACRAPYRSVPPTAWSEPAPSAVTAPGATDASTMEMTAPTHAVEPHDGSRMYLLDLYQKAMDEKDALVLELKSMQAALEHEEGVRKAAESERDALALKLRAAELGEHDLRAELSELVARLTTAQIRRLEAEKLLLESKIEAHKAQAENAPKMETSVPTTNRRNPPVSGHKP